VSPLKVLCSFFWDECNFFL